MADQKSGTAGTIAIIAAIGSFILTLTGNPIFGLLTAFAAVILGIIGVVISVSPKVGGGLISVLAIIIGLVDIGIAVLGVVGVIIF
ncbi:MAG: hypothetical protein SCH71_06865 [Desulfobulbaceae bacterium]|nr:hypothetical protein [Desulfobulbaceae bacterium]